MLERELYPTPPEIIAKMVEPYLVHNYCLSFQGLILEPHGGTGAILDYLCEKLHVRACLLRTIEIDPELRYLLQGKGYKVIESDFLAYNEPNEFGLILANPPFSNGVKHALKIWEVLASEGKAAILLNQETLDNPCSREREGLLELIRDFGSVETLGQCFKHSERPTDVEVALVRLAKPARASSIDFGELNLETDADVEDTEFAANPLAHRDIVKNLVVRYNSAVVALTERDRAQSKLSFYLQGIQSEVYESCSDRERKSLKLEASLSEQIAALKSRFWNTVFARTKLGERTTTHFHKKFDAFARAQANMAFSEKNVWEVLEMFCLNSDQIMQDCIVDIFDKLSKYCEKNKVHREGWKTNKSWRLNRKIIHPYGITYEKKWGFSMAWRECEVYNDLDTVLCYLSGVPIEKGITTAKAIDNFIKLRNIDYRQEFESYFFYLRIFKKGTVHLTFKDEKLLEDFNRKVAEGKNWLGDGS